MVLLLDAPVDAIALSRRLTDSAAAIRAVCQTPARVGLILGSGLGAVADALPDVRRLPFAHIPHFAPMGVEGHGGVMAIAAPGGLGVIALQGRYHYYEGHDMAAVTYPVRVLRALGVTTLILTNAAGGVNPAFGPGDLMLMVDHLNLMGVHPLRGPNDATLGPRFPDMTGAYDPVLRQMAREAAQATGVSLKEGVYAALSGPSYETPAEVRMLRTLGADAVGMSTVPEALVARHAGMRVLGLSCICNAAAGLGDAPLSHEDVLAAGERAKPRFQALLLTILQRLAAEADAAMDSKGLKISP